MNSARTNARQRRAPPAETAPLAMIALLAVVGLALAGMLASCARESIATHQPLRLTDVPTIRVRLTNPPVYRETVSSTGGYRLWADGKVVSESAGAMPAANVQYSTGCWHFNALAVRGDEIMIEPTAGLLRCGGVSYRGQLRLLPAGDRHFVVINHIDLESYLAGVLPKELYSTWSPVTYRALAVAARTFALYHMKTYGVGREFDVGDDQSSQVYGGASAETEKSWRAVRATHGQVLAYGPLGHERIFMAQYSACCGGVVNSASVIRPAANISPLVGGQRCDDCRACPRHTWPPVKVAKSDIFRAAAQAYPAIAKLDGLKTIRVADQTPYGRAVWLELVGRSGKAVRLRAEDLRLVLNRGVAGGRLNSMNCRIVDAGNAIEFVDGHGFGHGVGLCQWGAQAKAQQGWQAEDILRFYYPGATILPAY